MQLICTLIDFISASIYPRSFTIFVNKLSTNWTSEKVEHNLYLRFILGRSSEPDVEYNLKTDVEDDEELVEINAINKFRLTNEELSTALFTGNT